MSVSLDDVPSIARQAWTRLRDEAESILGDNLIGLWGSGGTVFADRSRPLGDLDTFGVLERIPDERAARALERAEGEIADEHHIDWDIWYVLASDAARSEPPAHAPDPSVG